MKRIQDCIATVLAMAEMSPGSEDRENRAELHQAKQAFEAIGSVLTAAEEVLRNWEGGNLSQPMQDLQRAVDQAREANLSKGSALVRNFLDLSTGHLNREARDYLQYIGDGLTVYELKYGWLVYVSDEDQLEDYPLLPTVIVEILNRARSLGCDYVLLDSDAEYDDELPSFEDEDDGE